MTGLCCLATGLFAQDAARNCSTMEVDARLRAEDPGYATRMEAIESFTQEYVSNNAGGTRATVTIPVVVHVVYNNATENISDAQILSQIDVLNDDFRRNNADAVFTAAGFLGVAADTEIEFCLASVDPSGNPTTGITRTSTTKTSFSTDDKVKQTSQGGIDAWDRDSYLNLWVCDLSGGLLGYAQFPGGAASTDGVVCDYQYFGTIGTATAPFDLGRTATHEVGHWLNLRHIWGDDGTSCAGSDLVADTPNQADETYGCPSTTRISCSNGPNGDMYQNYMDYTDDACMNILTSGQKTRMQALFSPGGARASIATSTACSGGGGGGPTCDVPGGRSTTGITESQASLNWASVTGATSYNVRGREVGTPTWTTGSTTGTSINYTGLTAGTDYEWQVGTVCSGGATSGYSTSLIFTTTGGGGGGCTDFGEPNDVSGASAPTINAGEVYSALIATSGDDDWYKFKTSNPATNIRVTLSSLPADYDVELYNKGTFVDVSENAGTSDEQIIWNTSTRGWRLVHVYGWAGVNDPTDCYDLLVEVSASSFRTDGSELFVDEDLRNGIMGLYPNPASDAVSMVYHSVLPKQDVQVSVMNVIGQTALTMNELTVEGDNLIQFDVSNLTPGIYVVDVFDGKSHYTERLVVN